MVISPRYARFAAVQPESNPTRPGPSTLRPGFSATQPVQKAEDVDEVLPTLLRQDRKCHIVHRRHCVTTLAEEGKKYAPFTDPKPGNKDTSMYPYPIQKWCPRADEDPFVFSVDNVRALIGTRLQDFQVWKVYVAAQGNYDLLSKIFNESFSRGGIKSARIPCGRAAVTLTPAGYQYITIGNIILSGDTGQRDRTSPAYVLGPGSGYERKLGRGVRGGQGLGVYGFVPGGIDNNVPGDRNLGGLALTHVTPTPKPWTSYPDELGRITDPNWPKEKVRSEVLLLGLGMATPSPAPKKHSKRARVVDIEAASQYGIATGPKAPARRVTSKPAPLDKSIPTSKFARPSKSILPTLPAPQAKSVQQEASPVSVQHDALPAQVQQVLPARTRRRAPDPPISLEHEMIDRWLKGLAPDPQVKAESLAPTEEPPKTHMEELIDTGIKHMQRMNAVPELRAYLCKWLIEGMVRCVERLDKEPPASPVGAHSWWRFREENKQAVKDWWDTFNSDVLNKPDDEAEGKKGLEK
ncbi:MAG: hypothetical protein L6R40_008591 [Gallowayella cf. fulva]|nr:MAG: hypothetical protein L6R40_008591 [Xanthomendoza cf. fulva]